MKTLALRIACAALAGAASFAAIAQSSGQPFPNRPVRLVVPFPAGGVSSSLSHALAEKLSASLGQPVVVDNRPGASGILAMDLTAKAAPDGHTIVLISPTTIGINPVLLKSMPFDVVKDFTPVALVAYTPLVLVVHPSVPASNLKELLAWLKANPDKAFYASPSPGNSSHLAAEMLKKRTGVEMTHVAFKGDAPAYQELLSGRVPVMFANAVSALPHMQAGRLRAIGLAGESRSPAMPNVPTMGEQGMANFDLAAWFGIAAPASTPPAVVARLNEDINKALQMPDVKEAFARLTATPGGMNVPEFVEFNRTERLKWGRLALDSGAKVDN